MDDHGAFPADSPLRPGGEIPGLPGVPAFSHRLSEPADLPILIAAPHGGRSYPAEITGELRDPGTAALRLEDRLIDLVASAVARETGTALLIAHAPRAMIDLNRDAQDVDWGMIAGPRPSGGAGLAAGRRALSGLGLVPRRLAGSGELWKRPLASHALKTRIARIHRPYHAMLAQMLESLRDSWGAALLVDLHSMPPLGPKGGLRAAPDFVIGDRFGVSCSGALSAAALDHLDLSGCRAAHNRPYAGGFVLDRHGRPARGIHAMQIEVCRSAYLDPPLRECGAGMPDVVAVLAGLIRRLAGELAGADRFRQAAE